MAVIINGTSGITNVNGSASTPAETGTDTDTGIYYGTNTVGLATNGTNALFIDASQNVGIGTTDTTNQRLKIKQSADTGAASFSFKVEANVNDTGLFLGYRGVGAATAADTCAINASYVSTGAFKPITFLTSDAERMRIDTSGNVGIGTSSPSYKLDVRSTLAVLDGSSNIGFYANGSAYTQIWQTLQSTNDFIIQTTASKYISFGINSAEKVRIDTSGNLLVGTTAQPATGVGVQVISFNNAYYGLRLSTSNSGGASCIQFLNSAGTQQGLISHNGTGTTTYGTSSDYRLKDNPQPMQNALETVAKLNPVTYTWKIDGSIGQGFIAHELQEIFPDAVQGEKDDVNEDGSIKPQGIDTSFLVATLTAAIQELKALVDTQASTITALTARIESLETK